MAMPAPTSVTKIAVSGRLRSSLRSSSGLSSRSCRRTNSQPTSAPATTAAAGRADAPSTASRLMPYSSRSTAASESPTLAGSSRPAWSLRHSGSRTDPASSSTAIAGMAARNTDPHQKCCSRNPASTGPRAPPVNWQVAQLAMARPRSVSSRNMLVISARVDGARVAPATPSSARVTISISGLTASAATADSTANAAAPASSSRLRPIRSPRVPIVMTRPATVIP